MKGTKKVFIIHSSLFISVALMLSACSDMLESDSSRQAFEPELNSKTDSVFYAYGIIQAMQQLADQYVFQGEMRGDLLTTTDYTDNNLRALYNHSADATNKYDSAYVYYRVINNCNYYIAHRDTTLRTGSTNVTLLEYAAVKAIRAWAYLQLGRTYKEVPFFTEPLTKISQIDDNHYDKLALKQIADRLIADLLPYTTYTLPLYGNAAIAMGSSNSHGSKAVVPTLCFVPVDVILGELYLETGDYPNAVKHFSTYLTKVGRVRNMSYMAMPAPTSPGDRLAQMTSQGRFGSSSTWPADYDMANRFNLGNTWSSIFTANNATQDIITYIPMAVNYVRGVTTDITKAFGYDYYSTASELSQSGTERNGRYLMEQQLVPSQQFLDLSDAQQFHYYATIPGELPKYHVNSVPWGDRRVVGATVTYNDDDSLYIWVDKYNQNANIILYRTSTVLLEMAEAYNRWGYPRVAFALLKDGISYYLTSSYCTYLTDDDKAVLAQTILTTENLSLIEDNQYCGIHTHGAGETRSFNGSNYIDDTPYMPNKVIGDKMQEIANVYGVAVDSTLNDTINAMEDLICDEMALELAWEGRRFNDLTRMARHKNESGLYGANFGSKWLARKLQYKQPARPMDNPDNWYLPFN